MPSTSQDPSSPEEPTPSTAPGRRTVLVVAGVVVAVLAVAGLAWSLLGTSPAEVDVSQAADAIDDGEDDVVDEGGEGEDTEGGDEDTDDGAAEPAVGVDGTWVVDTTIGEFSVTDTTGAFLGFRIDEELANVGATQAIGRTPDVEGTLRVTDGVLEQATVVGDLTGIVSDRPRRDGRVQGALNTAEHPTATFELTEPVDIGGLADGAVIEVDAVGTLTVNGIEQAVTVPLRATLQDDVAVVTGAVEVALADFGVEAPTAALVLSVSDVATVELQLYLTRG